MSKTFIVNQAFVVFMHHVQQHHRSERTGGEPPTLPPATLPTEKLLSSYSQFPAQGIQIKKNNLKAIWYS